MVYGKVAIVRFGGNVGGVIRRAEARLYGEKHPSRAWCTVRWQSYGLEAKRTGAFALSMIVGGYASHHPYPTSHSLWNNLIIVGTF
jgi:hypothetical protein